MICHGDVKPENLLIDRNGDLHITDFGLTKVRRDFDFVSGGTPQYMSPEHWLGQTLDVGSDLYAFGLVLYELCYGHLPWSSHTLDELRVEHLQREITLLPHPLRTLVAGCLEKDRDRRYSLEQALALLRNIAHVSEIALPTVRLADDDDLRVCPERLGWIA
jgi:serine/threonine protein kinase